MRLGRLKFGATVGLALACLLLAAVPCACRRKTTDLAAGPHQVSGKDTKIDAVLVLDISGSMDRNDRDMLRVDATKMFVSLLPNGCQVGVIQFSDEGATLAPLRMLKEQTDRDQLFQAVEGLKNKGIFTDMVSGLQAAIQMLEGSSQPANRKVIVLLTDGQEQPNPNQPRFKAAPYPPKPTTSIAAAYAGEVEGVSDVSLIREIKAKYWKMIQKEVDGPLLFDMGDKIRDKGWDLYCVGLSESTDRALLENIARHSSRNEARDYFLYAAQAPELCKRFVQIVEGILEIDDEPVHAEVTVQPGGREVQSLPINLFIDQAVITVVNGDKTLGKTLKVSLSEPGGAGPAVKPALNSAGALVYPQTLPKSGPWRLELANEGTRAGTVQVYYFGFSNLCLLSGKLNQAGDLFVGRPMALSAAFDYLERYPVAAGQDVRAKLDKWIKDYASQTIVAELQPLDVKDAPAQRVELGHKGQGFVGQFVPKQAGRWRVTFTGRITREDQVVQRSIVDYFTVGSEIFWKPRDGRDLNFGKLFAGRWLRQKRTKKVYLTCSSTQPETVRLSWQVQPWTQTPDGALIKPLIEPAHVDIPANGSKDVELTLVYDADDQNELKRGQFRGQLKPILIGEQSALAAKMKPIELRLKVKDWWDYIFLVLKIGTSGLAIAALLIAIGYGLEWWRRPFPSGKYRLNNGPPRDVPKPRGLWRKFWLLTKNRCRIGGPECEIDISREIVLGAGLNRPAYKDLLLQKNGIKIRLRRHNAGDPVAPPDDAPNPPETATSVKLGEAPSALGAPPEIWTPAAPPPEAAAESLAPEDYFSRKTPHAQPGGEEAPARATRRRSAPRAPNKEELPAPRKDGALAEWVFKRSHRTVRAIACADRTVLVFRGEDAAKRGEELESRINDLSVIYQDMPRGRSKTGLAGPPDPPGKKNKLQIGRIY